MVKTIGKVVLAALLLLPVLHSQSQSPLVSVQFDKESVIQGDTVAFSIFCNDNKQFEVIVFSDGFLGFQQNVQIAYGEMPFHIATADFPLGRYYILVSGEDVHIEKEFLLWKK